jgi:hypothetical protein
MRLVINNVNIWTFVLTLLLAASVDFLRWLIICIRILLSFSALANISSNSRIWSWIYIVQLVIRRLVINILNNWIFMLTFSMWWQQSSGSEELESFVSNILISTEDDLSSSVLNIIRSTDDSSSFFSCLRGVPVWEESVAES